MRHRSRSVSIRLGLVAAAALTFASTAAAQNLVGLSAVRSQRFGNDNLSGIVTPQTGDQFAFSLAAGDFNGDGADDLATGMPYDNGLAAGLVNDSGSVVVRYSRPGSGLTTNPSQIYLRQQRDPAEPGDNFGWSLAACDFNGDGYDDLAVGVPHEDYLSEDDSGIVHVYYGTASGLPPSGDTYFAQSTPGVPDNVEEEDVFGRSLACGDFDNDGFDDLAVGVPGELFDESTCIPISPITCPADFDQGRVILVPGSPFGLAYAGSSHLDQNVPGMLDEAETFDLFGWSLAAGDFDGDGYDDLGIGVPGEDSRKGEVAVVFGGPSGLSPGGNTYWSEVHFPGGLSESGDRFGETLAAGDFQGDGFDDLVIGIPIDGVNPQNPKSGQIGVAYGGSGGTQLWSEDNIWYLGTSEANDQFGGALAVGDFDRDGRDDLAIGRPGEFVWGPNDGAITILMGSAFGLTTARRRDIAPGVEGFPGDISQHDKNFAFSLAAGDFDGDGHSDLAIGVPNENQGGIADVGAETVLYGALFGDGFETANTLQWPQTVSQSALINNEVRATTTARLGPSTSQHGPSRYGLQVSLLSPTIQRPTAAAFVRVGPESGFDNETALKGSFFINPQNLGMSTLAGKNGFQMIAFTDGIVAGSKTRLIFNLVRNSADGDWFINVQHFNDNFGSFQLSGGGFFAPDNDVSFTNNRIDFAWERGNPGQLTMWRTRYLNGVPDGNGTTQMFSVPLPGMQNAVINHVFAGMFGGHDVGTAGQLYLDEFVFRR